MNKPLLRMFEKIQIRMAKKEGQDLVEYSMAFAVIGLGTAAGMESVAVAILNVFNTITGILAPYFNA